MDYFFLSKTLLFQGIHPLDLPAMLSCLGAKQQSFSKDTHIYQTGDMVTSLGIVLTGSVRIESIDLWGNTSVLDLAGSGSVFAETYACIPQEPLMVDVVAADSCEILFIDIQRLLTTCSNTCKHHSRLIRNLLTISARKNLTLSRRIFHTSSKSIRGRLLSYLSFQAAQHGSCQFSIPFNRQQLADYLNVDRSALSNELSKMRREGLLNTDRNWFFLKKLPQE